MFYDLSGKREMDFGISKCIERVGLVLITQTRSERERGRFLWFSVAFVDSDLIEGTRSKESL